MSDSRLLPVGSSPLEVAAAKACAEITRVPVPLRTLWNPATCPVNLLPYLAWALSVDRWDERWSETTKRSVITASFYVHKHKGTISALRRVVEPLGYGELGDSNPITGTYGGGFRRAKRAGNSDRRQQRQYAAGLYHPEGNQRELCPA